eukprot:tig00000789_g4116.t1
MEQDAAEPAAEPRDAAPDDLPAEAEAAPDKPATEAAEPAESVEDSAKETADQPAGALTDDDEAVDATDAAAVGEAAAELATEEALPAEESAEPDAAADGEPALEEAGDEAAAAGEEEAADAAPEEAGEPAGEAEAAQEQEQEQEQAAGAGAGEEAPAAPGDDAGAEPSAEPDRCGEGGAGGRDGERHAATLGGGGGGVAVGGLQQHGGLAAARPGGPAGRKRAGREAAERGGGGAGAEAPRPPPLDAQAVLSAELPSPRVSSRPLSTRFQRVSDARLEEVTASGYVLPERPAAATTASASASGPASPGPERGRKAATPIYNYRGHKAKILKQQSNTDALVGLPVPPPSKPPALRRSDAEAAAAQQARQAAAERTFRKHLAHAHKRRVLDGFALLAASGEEDPGEAVDAVLVGREFNEVSEEDLPFFARLARADLGDNNVQLAQLAGLPALRELHLYCNGLASLSVPDGAFAALEVLNLAYNGLSWECLPRLAALPALRELDLSHNALAALPPDWAPFAALEILSLEHNRLARDAPLLALASAPRLRVLNLRGNQLQRFPEGAGAGSGFGQLAALNLAQNAVGEEAGLLPLAALPALEELLLPDLCAALEAAAEAAGRAPAVLVVADGAPRPLPPVIGRTYARAVAHAARPAPAGRASAARSDELEGASMSASGDGRSTAPHGRPPGALEFVSAGGAFLTQVGPQAAGFYEEEEEEEDPDMELEEADYFSDGEEGAAAAVQGVRARLLPPLAPGTKMRGETRSAATALRFMLAHPSHVPAAARSGPQKSHERLTAIRKIQAAMNQEVRMAAIERLERERRPRRPQKQPSTVGRVEKLLGAMKERLAAVEANLGAALSNDTTLQSTFLGTFPVQYGAAQAAAALGFAPDPSGPAPLPIVPPGPASRSGPLAR